MIEADEVRDAVNALLEIYDTQNARLTLALKELDRAAAEIDRRGRSSRDWKTEQPRRFQRTVHAVCGAMCIYPRCECGAAPCEVEAMIAAWGDYAD